MKQYSLIHTFLIFSIGLYSQVGIGNSTPNEAALVDMSNATNKGLLIPQIELVALADKSPITSPSDGLLVYNLTKTTTSADDTQNLHEGYYYWSKADAKWTPWVTEKNVTRVAKLTNNVNAFATSGVESSSVYVDDIDNEGDAAGTKWIEIPGAEANITIDKVKNEMYVTVSGTVLANNTGSNPTGFTYSVGVFVDGELKILRHITFYNRGSCGKDSFLISGLISDSSLATHTIKVYVKNRNPKVSGNQDTLYYGKETGTSQCNNVTDDMAKFNLNILTTQHID